MYGFHKMHLDRNSLVIVSAKNPAIHVLVYSFINAKNLFKMMPNTNFKSQNIQNLKFHTL